MIDKSPAFQWYPKDYLTDENVMVMTLEEEGAYRRLMDHCWLQGSIPNDMRSLAALCKNITTSRMKKLWLNLQSCFQLDGDRWIHPRIEKERAKQKARKQAKSAAGSKGAAKRWGKQSHSSAIGLPLANDSPSSASASATTATHSSLSPRDELGEWLGEYDEAVSNHPLTGQPEVRRTLFQHFGPPGLRANAWSKDDGESVPADDRPRLLALALTGYAAEGHRTIVANQFAGMLRKTVRDEYRPRLDKTGTDDLSHWDD